tara:strand:- start:271 stop:591 length:321 start_codon:yes stop_codon:yes gene_type:complete
LAIDASKSLRSAEPDDCAPLLDDDETFDEEDRSVELDEDEAIGAGDGTEEADFEVEERLSVTIQSTSTEPEAPEADTVLSRALVESARSIVICSSIGRPTARARPI